MQRKKTKFKTFLFAGNEPSSMLGFGAVVALVALAVSYLLALRRKESRQTRNRDNIKDNK